MVSSDAALSPSGLGDPFAALDLDLSLVLTSRPRLGTRRSSEVLVFYLLGATLGVSGALFGLILLLFLPSDCGLSDDGTTIASSFASTSHCPCCSMQCFGTVSDFFVSSGSTV